MAWNTRVTGTTTELTGVEFQFGLIEQCTVLNLLKETWKATGYKFYKKVLFLVENLSTTCEKDLEYKQKAMVKFTRAFGEKINSMDHSFFI